MLALHSEVPGLYNYLPWQYPAGEGGLFYSTQVEMLCDQAWGSMLCAKFFVILVPVGCVC